MLIRWVGVNEAGSGSIFAVFAALARGDVDSFPALRPHQREPWHAFCVQVAAMALIHAGEDELPGAEEDWRRLLIGLTPDWPDGEAWSLVVHDWSRPALLQPPVKSPANIADYKNRLATPDALDMLVTSKNHDVKQGRMVGARDEDWLFALVTLQTYEGFLGARNYGISRMNTGSGSRMSLGVRPAGGASAAFIRDVRRLVATAAKRPDWRRGLPLLWLRPWDGTESLSFGALDELYVDICRRVRLVRDGDALAARTAGSKIPRVAAAALQGRTGDPWAPVKGDGSASVTPSAAGFGYRQITRLLDRNETNRPLLAEPAADDDHEGLSLVATALVRGQGKTKGWHRRAIAFSRNIPVGPKEQFLDRMGRVAKVRSDDAGKARGALRRALFSLMQGGPDQIRLDDASSERKAEPWTGRFEAEVDRIFFDAAFWAEVDEHPGLHRHPWRVRLRGIAREIFDEAAEAAPRTDVRRIRARVRARSFLDAQLYRFVEETDGE